VTPAKKQKHTGRHAAVVARISSWQCYALVALAVAIAYVPVYSAGFIWDDDSHVVKNPNLGDLAGLGRIWFAPLSNPQYYPVVHTTFWCERQLWGLYPPAFRTLTASPRHHLADPAPAARLLGVDADDLLHGRDGGPKIPRDGTLLGNLFASLVTPGGRVAVVPAGALGP
jgi:hypothetical protein